MAPRVFQISHRFDAPLHWLWQAFTTEAGLAAWLGEAQTQVTCLHLNPVAQGALHYVVQADGAEPYYGRWDFLSVAPYQQLEYYLAFSDEQGNSVHHTRAPNWPLLTHVQVVFSVREDDTCLEITAAPAAQSTPLEVAFFAEATEYLTLNWQESFAALENYLAQRQAAKAVINQK